MPNARYTTLAMCAALALTSTVASAQTTQVGPFLPTVPEAINAAEQGVENVCASRGGVASFTVLNIIQNAGYFAARFQYSCVN
jgi:hypothetical protein